jgi:hypothetical protein
MAFDATATQETSPRGRILVLGGEAARQHELTAAVRGLGHHAGNSLHEPAGVPVEVWSQADTVLVLAEEEDARWAGHAMTIHRDPAAPPLVVLGPQTGQTWRRRALKAGAFLCACQDVSPEELQSILLAAIRYRALQKEINLLRVECERICLGLLKSYGEAAATLKDTAEEVEALQQNLSDIRNQIIRAFV